MRKSMFVVFVFVFLTMPVVAAAAMDVPSNTNVATLRQWEETENKYTEALNSVAGVQSAMHRYLRWAEDGPTSSAKSISNIGCMEWDLERIQNAADEQAKINLSVPAIDEPFAMMAGYAKELQTINKAAYMYYANKRYLEDDMAKGKELHPKLVKAYEDFITSFYIVSRLKKEIANKLEPLRIAYAENKYGKQYYWHHLNLMAKARAVISLLSEGAANRDTVARNKKVTDFAAALVEFETYYEKTGKEAIRKQALFSFTPNSFNHFLAASCGLLVQELGKEKLSNANSTKYVNSMRYHYKILISDSNSTRFVLPK